MITSSMSWRTTFTGGVFSDEIEGGRAGAEIELGSTDIIATMSDGDHFLVPYHECQIEIGGFSGRMVFCRDADRSVTIFCEDRAFPEALSRAASGRLSQRVAEQLQSRRSDRWRGWRLAVGLTVAFVALVWGGLWALRAGTRAVVHALPMSVDEKIGSLAFKSMDMEGPELHDPLIVDAIQAMVDRLAPHAKIDGLKYQVHVIDAPIVNAFALPGGTIVVFTGLLAKAENGEQVAGVLAHEMAHVTLRHGLERVAESANLVLAIQILIGDAQGLIAFGAQLFTLATVSSHSRAQETAADDEGVRMLHAAGIDPLSLAGFLALLDKEHGALPEAVAWISSHPQNHDRIARIRQRSGELQSEQPYEPAVADWQAVQRRVKRQPDPEPEPNPESE